MQFLSNQVHIAGKAKRKPRQVQVCIQPSKQEPPKGSFSHTHRPPSGFPLGKQTKQQGPHGSNSRRTFSMTSSPKKRKMDQGERIPERLHFHRDFGVNSLKSSYNAWRAGGYIIDIHTIQNTPAGWVWARSKPSDAGCQKPRDLLKQYLEKSMSQEHGAMYWAMGGPKLDLLKKPTSASARTRTEGEAHSWLCAQGGAQQDTRIPSGQQTGRQGLLLGYQGEHFRTKTRTSEKTILSKNST